MERIRLSGNYDFYFLEAALLIEENYDKICDELWYVYADEDARRERLKKARGYSDEKIDDMIGSQKSEEEFSRSCAETIDNSGSAEETYEQLDRLINIKSL